MKVIEESPARCESRNTQHINVEEGLKFFDGRKAAYLRILARFIELQGDAPQQMIGLLEKGDIESATRTAHSLKGSSASLCIGLMRQIASSLEQLLETRPDDPEIPALLASATLLMEEVREEIRQLTSNP